MRNEARCLGAILLGCVLGAAPRAAQAQNAKVVITGGADETTQNYRWQVTNRSTSRIVRIEFPQYAADLFESPDGWHQGTQVEMNLVRIGWNSKPGRCWSEPKLGNDGLGSGVSAFFGMRVSGSIGALKAPGTVTVKFADGSVAQVPGVELPTQPVKTSPWVAPVGMGVILVLFIVYRERKKRRQPRPSINEDSNMDETITSA